MQPHERELLKHDLRDECQGSLDERVDRWLEVRHQGIVPNHHFAYASSEYVNNLYRDGYFLSAVMVSQAVNEGIWKFVLERNQIARANMPTLVAELITLGILSQACGDAFVGIWNSFRNDVHHMNPPVANVPFRTVAKDNLRHLTTIEREIFGVDFRDGKIVPKQQKYWDLRPDGTAEVFLRFPSIG